MITIRTIEDRVLINAPFPCKIVELNGDVEDNSDLVNEDAYQDGWCMIVRPTNGTKICTSTNQST